MSTTVNVMDSQTPQAAPAAPLGLPEVRFTAPLLGLEHLDRFALAEVDPESPLLSLQSLQDDTVRLLVLEPAEVVTGYEPAFDGVARAAVGLPPGADGVLLVVVTPGESLEDSTVNLLAPILVNPGSGAAAQVVLTGSTYPLRQSLAA